MKEDITRADRDGVIVVTLNRPEKRNAMTIAMRETLFRAVDDLRDNDDLRVLMIRAEGPFFTAGIDVKEHYALYPPSRGMQEFRRDYRRNIHRFLDEMEAVEKPIVMAINGPCLGLGVEMAGAVDFRLASSDARFALPEVDMGIIAGSGGTSRIVRLCGVGWAKWLGMAGEAIDAQTALAAGLVQAVWSPDEFDDKAMGFCRRLAGKPIDAVGMAKLAIDLCRDLDRSGGRTLERIANTPLILDGNKRIADREAGGDKDQA